LWCHLIVQNARLLLKVTGKSLGAFQNQYALSMLQDLARGSVYKGYRQAKYGGLITETTL
jgi:hypothetical protein